MATRYLTEPWDTWPRKATPSYNRGKPFQASYSSTLGALDREMRHLGAAQCIIQMKVKRGDIRADGLPRETMTTQEPGVILTFDRKGRSISMPCDACNHWQQNLRAVVLTLERLRLAELYGVTSNGEQYRGWEALPPPGAPAAEQAMTVEKALDVIARYSGMPQDLIRTSPKWRESALKEARIAVHPDRGGFHPETAKEVGQAAELLKKELGS